MIRIRRESLFAITVWRRITKLFLESMIHNQLKKQFCMSGFHTCLMTILSKCFAPAVSKYILYMKNKGIKKAALNQTVS